MLFRSTNEQKTASGGYVTASSSQKYGYTNGTYVNIRSHANTSAAIVATIPNSGTQVLVTGGYVEPGDGRYWWPVNWNGYMGYIRGDYLVVP